MARFTRAELESYRDAEVPDLLGPATRLLFVGINPGLRTAAIQTHFGKPGNRFWPALLLAGIIEEPVDLTDPMTDEVRAALRGARDRHLQRRAPGDRARRRAHGRRAPRGRRAVASPSSNGSRRAWSRCSASRRTAPPSGCPRPSSGRQPDGLGPAELWVVPNPSGLNAHETVDSLAAAYAEPARAAGIIR